MEITNLAILLLCAGIFGLLFTVLCAIEWAWNRYSGAARSRRRWRYHMRDVK